LVTRSGEIPESLRALDAAVFGVDRWPMVTALAGDSHRSLVMARNGGGAAGYGLARPGARACYLGPVVADRPEVGVSVIRQLLADGGDLPCFWDIPEANQASVELARELGFSPQRPLIRMYLGDAPCSGIPHQQFAIADPAVG
jgi:hypothetical protein